MEPILFYIAIVLISLSANTLSQIAGGGTALINIPLLILLGIDPRIAIASTNMSSFGGITALPTYIKNNKVVWKIIPFLFIASIIAAIGGSTLLISLSSAQVEKIFGGIILFLIPLIFLKKKWGVTHDTIKPRWLQLIGIILYIIVAIGQAGLGAGLGLVATYILVTFFGYSIIHANATRRIVLIVQNGLTFFILWYNDLVDLKIGLALLIGSIIGSYLGARLVIYKGNTFVKIFFISLVTISGIKLLL